MAAAPVSDTDYRGVGMPGLGGDTEAERHRLLRSGYTSDWRSDSSTPAAGRGGRVASGKRDPGM